MTRNVPGALRGKALAVDRRSGMGRWRTGRVRAEKKTAERPVASKAEGLGPRASRAARQATRRPRRAAGSCAATPCRGAVSRRCTPRAATASGAMTTLLEHDAKLGCFVRERLPRARSPGGSPAGRTWRGAGDRRLSSRRCSPSSTEAGREAPDATAARASRAHRRQTPSAVLHQLAGRSLDPRPARGRPGAQVRRAPEGRPPDLSAGPAGARPQGARGIRFVLAARLAGKSPAGYRGGD